MDCRHARDPVSCLKPLYVTCSAPGGLQVGDDPTTVLTDLRTGATVGKLAAQRDYAFAAAWHPHGNLLATGETY